MKSGKVCGRKAVRPARDRPKLNYHGSITIDADFDLASPDPDGEFPVRLKDLETGDTIMFARLFAEFLLKQISPRNIDAQHSRKKHR